MQDTATEFTESSGTKRQFVFRGDNNYFGGSVGRVFGPEADAADIQDFADHVLRKESNRSSRFVSFTLEIKVARKFTCASDNRYVSRAELAELRKLESQTTIKIWDPDLVYKALMEGPRKLAKQAADVRAAMKRNSEILIEGQIPAAVLERAK